MIDKDEALANLARAYLDSKVAWTIYLETAGGDDGLRVSDGLRVKMLRAETKYDTMAQVYRECDVLTLAEIHDSWFYKTKIVVAS